MLCIERKIKMICPKCKNEYREGFTVCADCGVALIEQEDTIERQMVIYGTQEQMNNLKGFIEHNGIKNCEVKFGSSVGYYELWIPTKSVQKATKYVQAFMMHERERVEQMMQQPIQKPMKQVAKEDDRWSEPVGNIKISNTNSVNIQKDAENDAVQNKEATKKLYLDGADKVKDYRSTGYCFTAVGLLGMVAVAASIMLGYLHLGITTGAMFVMFLIFFLIGIGSFKSVKAMKKEVEQSDSLMDTITIWCQENLKKENIDAMIDVEMDSSEMLYFERFNCIKKLINDKFMNLDQALLERYIDDTVYEMIFGEE